MGGSQGPARLLIGRAWTPGWAGWDRRAGAMQKSLPEMEGVPAKADSYGYLDREGAATGYSVS